MNIPAFVLEDTYLKWSGRVVGQVLELHITRYQFVAPNVFSDYLYMIYIYTIEVEKLKLFLTKIRPTTPLMKVPRVRPKGSTKGGGDPFFDRKKMFYQKVIFSTRGLRIQTQQTHHFLIGPA